MTSNFKCFGLILLATSLVTSPARAAEPLDIPFEMYTLESNGLEVILHHDSSLPIVAVNIWYHAGPINEAPGRTGFAHLFEHLMFQGSMHVGDDAHFKLLSAAGATMLNGTTGNDRTNYFETVPSNQLELALWLESDRMGFLPESLTQEKLDNQRDVVKNERRQSVENRPYGPSDEAMTQTIFAPEHPYYGNVIGSMQHLSAATLDDVKDFFNVYYAPANATLVIAGDFEAAQTKALVEKYFGTLPRRQAPAERKVETAALTQERRKVIEEPVMLPRVAMGWLSAPFYAPGDAQADLLAFILGAGKSSRLYRRLVYDLELAQNVSAHQQSNALASVFTVEVTGRPGVDPKELEEETWKVIEEIRQKAPSDRELLRARNMLVTSTIKGLQRVGGFGGKADMLNRYNQYLGKPGYLAEDLARYSRITAEAVRETAQALLSPKARAVIVTVPAKGDAS